jgi:queuine/archaeosine tRNA-ribosyltransferase
MAFETVETPLPVFKTYIGNLLYSTLDLNDEIIATAPAVLGQVDIQDIFGRDFADISIGDIQVQRDATEEVTVNSDVSPKHLRMNVLSSRQKSELGSNPNGIFVDTAGGRKVLTVTDYSKRIKADKFPAVIALSEEIPLFAGLKRCGKARSKSLLWLEQLKNTTVNLERTYLFGVTCAFSDDQHLSVASSTSVELDSGIMTNASKLLSLGCDGLVVGGAGMGESLHQLEVAIRSVKAAASATTTEIIADNNSSSSSSSGSSRRVLIMVQEMNTIKEILSAVESGGDLIGTNLPQVLSSSGLALTWNLKGKFGLAISDVGSVKSDASDSEKRKQYSPTSGGDSTNDSLENPTKRQNTDIAAVIPALSTRNTAAISVDASISASIDDDEETDVRSRTTPDDFKHAHTNGGIINLWDIIHRKSLQPILANCICHACRNHTRAYVHHLLLAKEMLGDILLYCHNQHQILQMFNEIRLVKEIDKNSLTGDGSVFNGWKNELMATM